MPGTVIAVIHGNEGSHPTRPVTVPNYAPGGLVFDNRGGDAAMGGGQYWFDAVANLPFGKGMVMESAGSTPCAIASQTQVTLSGAFCHEIWLDRLDDSHRVVWSIGTDGGEGGTQLLALRGRPQGGGNWKLDLYGKNVGGFYGIALSGDFTFPEGVESRHIATIRDSAGYLKITMGGVLLATSAAPVTETFIGYLNIFGMWDRTNQYSDGIFRCYTGEARLTVDDPVYTTFPFTPPAARFPNPTSGYSLSVDPVAYTLGTPAVSTRVARALAVSPVAYALAPAPVALKVGRNLAVAPVAYTVSGAPVSLAATKSLSVAPVSYDLTPAPVSLLVGKRLNVDPASYAVAAAPVTLIYTQAAIVYPLNVDPTSYAVTPAPVTLRVNRRLSVDPTSYALTNFPVTFLQSRALAVSPASYFVDASPVNLVYTQKPKPPGDGSNGLRRWLIQQYTSYFEKREKEKALAEVAKEIEQISAGVVKVKERPVEPKPVVLYDERALELIRIRLQRQQEQERLATLQALYESSRVLAERPRFLSDPEILPRSPEDEDEDLLLLSIL